MAYYLLTLLQEFRNNIILTKRDIIADSVRQLLNIWGRVLHWNRLITPYLNLSSFYFPPLKHRPVHRGEMDSAVIWGTKGGRGQRSGLVSLPNWAIAHVQSLIFLVGHVTYWYRLRHLLGLQLKSPIRRKGEPGERDWTSYLVKSICCSLCVSLGV